jgi:hypothetical protein
MHRWILLALTVLLAACASQRADLKRTETLDRFEAIVRWNQFESIPDFMHPDYRDENPVRSIDLERLDQFRVSQYEVKQVLTVGEGEGLDRLVELRLYNRHTARERVVEYVESWRWDTERERWMLHSGLPDPTDGR